MKLVENVKGMAAGAKIVMIKNGPTIGLVVGSALVIAGTILACKETVKAHDILNERKEELEAIEKAKQVTEENGSPEDYTPEDQKHDTLMANRNCAVALVKNYAPAAAVTGVGFAIIFKSFGVLNNRNAILAAGLADVTRRFGDYRQRVIETEGSVKDRLYMYGKESKEETAEYVDEETGEKKEVPVKSMEATKEELEGTYSKYAKFFEESNPYYQPNGIFNCNFLIGRQGFANTLLRTQGFLFLNDVYKLIGIAPTIAGQTMGWVWTNEDKEKFLKNPSYSKVDFGIMNLIDHPVNEDFVAGRESVILLDFENVVDVLHSKESNKLMLEF